MLAVAQSRTQVTRASTKRRVHLPPQELRANPTHQTLLCKGRPHHVLVAWIHILAKGRDKGAEGCGHHKTRFQAPCSSAKRGAEAGDITGAGQQLGGRGKGPVRLRSGAQTTEWPAPH